MKLDVVVLTETKKKSCGVEEKGNYIHIYRGVEREERTSKGVSVLIKKKFKINITNYECINEQIVKVNMYEHIQLQNISTGYLCSK